MGRPALCMVLLALLCHSHGLETNPLYRSKRIQESAESDPSDCSSRTDQPQILTDSDLSVPLRMPGVTPAKSDTYVCMAFPVPTSQTAYVVDFMPQASMSTVHHMLLFGCKTPVSTTGYWVCGSVRGTCVDKSSVLYAWARDAPHTQLPKDVGFKVGRNSGVSYFVLQIHYGDIQAFQDHHRDCSGLSLRMTSKPQPFIAGIYLLMSLDTVILPGKRVTNADIACDYSSHPIYPFAFRTHTHGLGKVVSGYRIRNGEWSLIGRQSPQLPQAFYPSNHDVGVNNGDILAARCMFTGEGRTENTYLGGTSDDEMCNFYIMYYMESKHAVPYMSCVEPGPAKLFQHIPPEANIPINVTPDNMNSMMHMGGHSSTTALGELSDLPTLPRGHKDSTSTADSTSEVQLLDQDVHLEQNPAWPQDSLQLGQVTGLAIDSDSNLVIFHRGDHVWGPNDTSEVSFMDGRNHTSFDSRAVYQQRFSGPIQQSTILVVNVDNGNILKASGRNLFYLPHGIATDKDNNYWVTDVALHQVLKVSSDGSDRTLLSLGEAFTAGSDHNHFCQPTDVVVDDQTGNIFVSDGYCNARILKFSTDGKYLSEWGAGSTDRRRRIPFLIPHSLAFLPERSEVCVADRENGRIQCFAAQTGEFVKEIKKEEFGGTVYAITFLPAGGEDDLIFAVSGQSSYGQPPPPSGFTINYSTKDIVDAFIPKKGEFQMPHDIAVSRNGSIFVGDAGSNAVFKFTAEKAHRSVKKAGIEVEELEEIETFVQTKVKPEQNMSKTAAGQKTPQHLQPQQDEKKKKVSNKEQSLLPVFISVLLLLPLLVVISLGVFFCWRKNHRREDMKMEPSAVGGILEKIRGKAVGSLNLGNFFASRKGYSRQGFDQLSTDGSDQERHEQESSESENEEYSAPLPPPSS